MSVLLLVLRILLWVLLAVLALLLVVLLLPASVFLRFERGVFHVSAKLLGFRFTLLPKKKGQTAGKTAQETRSAEADAGAEPAASASDENVEDTAKKTPDETAVQEDASPMPDEPAQPEGAQQERAQSARVADEARTAPQQASGVDSGTPQQPAPNGQGSGADAAGAKAGGEVPDAALAEEAPGLWAKIKPYLYPAREAVAFLLRHMWVKDVTVVLNVRSDDPARVGFKSGVAWMLIGDVMKTLNAVFGSHVSYGELTVMPCFHKTDGARERFSCQITAAPVIIILTAAGFLIRLQREKRTLARDGQKER